MCNDVEAPRLVWWEKTVEYFFMAKTFGTSSASMFPFAGPTETALGDAVFAEAEEYAIIEFKIDKSKINTELRKYDPYQLEVLGIKASQPRRYEDYKEAVRRQINIDLRRDFLEPHNMVYCSLSRKQRKLELHITENWNCNNKVDWPITSPPDEFWHYAKALAQTREESEQGEIPEGIVLGLSKDRIVTLTVLDFLLDTLRHKQVPSLRFNEKLDANNPDETPDMKPW